MVIRTQKRCVWTTEMGTAVSIGDLRKCIAFEKTASEKNGYHNETCLRRLPPSSASYISRDRLNESRRPFWTTSERSDYFLVYIRHLNIFVMHIEPSDEQACLQLWNDVPKV